MTVSAKHGKSAMDKCTDDYYKVRRTLTWSAENAGYSGACGVPGAKGKCPMCSAVEKFGSCYDSECSAGQHGSEGAECKKYAQSKKSVALEWEQVCDPPCKNITKLMACQSKFQAAQKIFASDPKSSPYCAEYVEFKQCVKSEIGTCKAEVQASMSDQLEAMSVSAAFVCEPHCKEYFEGKQKCMSEMQQGMKDFSRAHMDACTTGEGECKACPFFLESVQCESRLPRCSHAKIAEQASQDAANMKAQFASMCPENFHKQPILL